MTDMAAMYRAGAEAASQYIVDEEPGYVCPLCIEIIRDLGDLSREHVPPRAVGGRVLCLLCRECNSRAGQAVDAAMAERIAAKRVMKEGTTNKYIGLKIDDLMVKATLTREGTHAKLEVAPTHNNPSNIETFNRLIESSDPGTKIDVIYSHQFNDHFEMVGYLKAAYLYAFAKFGYGYILRACMDIVRRQIQNPKEKVIWKWWLARDNDESDQSMIYRCIAPINCLAVGIFGHFIILPSLQEPFDQYDRVRKLTEGTDPQHFVGQFEVRNAFPVPTRMELICENPRRLTNV